MLDVSRAYTVQLAVTGKIRARKSGGIWLILREDVEQYDAQHTRAQARSPRRRREWIEDFEDTRDDHHGSIVNAARRLNAKPATLAAALYRARAAGWCGNFHDDTKTIR